MTQAQMVALAEKLRIVINRQIGTTESGKSIIAKVGLVSTDIDALVTNIVGNLPYAIDAFIAEDLGIELPEE